MKRLYLDTARLGLLRPGARRLYQDFVRFAGEEGFTLYWDEFLRAGGGNWPDALRRRYPALNAWRGIPHLKDALTRLAGAAPGTSVLLANRSAMLMKLAARLLSSRCRHVMTTDLSWPGYAAFLRQERGRAGMRITRVKVRKRLLRRGMSNEMLVELLAYRFFQLGCDGLFLPAVDHFGVRIPVGEIVQEIERRSELSFVVLDGAQALAHVPLGLAEVQYDFFIAGSHKWLGAHHPLGMAFFGNPRSADSIRQSVRREIDRRVVDDPLLRFSHELENGCGSRFGETVNVAPLLTAQGAVDDCDPGCLSTTLRARLANADRLLSHIHGTDWQPLLPEANLRSGILMLEARPARPARSAEHARQMLHQHGIAASTYDHGLIRLSMPAAEWSAEELDHLARFFRGP